MNGFGLSRERFALLFSVMLVAAAGNTAMQSLLPAIGRELGVADIWVAVAFSPVGGDLGGDGAGLGAPRRPPRPAGADAARPLRLHRLDADLRRSRSPRGLPGSPAPMLVFTIFMLGRTFYGAFGSASPPAVQAYIAARTEGAERTNALAAIASSFGLGTIIGPAIAPFFIFPPLGLSAPLFAFAADRRRWCSPLVALRLPDDTPQARGARSDRRLSGDRRRGRRGRARGGRSGAARAGATRGSCPGT